MSAIKLQKMSDVDEQALIEELIAAVPPEQQEQAREMAAQLKSDEFDLDLSDINQNIKFLASLMNMMMSEESRRTALEIAQRVVEAQRTIFAEYGAVMPSVIIFVISIIFSAQLERCMQKDDD